LGGALSAGFGSIADGLSNDRLVRNSADRDW
jgi:hypothetical protein